MFTIIDNNKIIENISCIARFAGLEIMNFYSGTERSQLKVYKKLDQSFVTNADLRAHHIISYLLYNLTPHIPILSEEQLPLWEQCKEWNRFWLIDPLDGTSEFLSHNGEFTVNIAFIEYGQPVMGVIYLPAYNVLYASDNGRVWKVDAQGKCISILTQVSTHPIVVVSRSHFRCDQKKLFNYLSKIKNYKLLHVGSSFKFCLVAEGFAQFYPRFSHTKIWDTAAGHVIAKSAGAIINDWDGNALDYKNINKSFLNPGFQVLLC